MAKKALKVVKGNSAKKTEAAPVKKVSKVEKPAKAAKADKAPKSTRNTGKTTGMKIAAFQDMLMAKNHKAKLTDAQLAKAMRDEFPNAIEYTENHVRGIRSQWNNGARASQEGVAPDKTLPEYAADGSVVERRRGPAPSGEKKAAKKDKSAKGGKKAKKVEPEEDEEDVEDEDVEDEDEEDGDEDEE